MGNKFTKSPWMVKNEFIVNSDNNTICRVFYASQANLIACAPEMYELLSEMVRQDSFVFYHQITKAIELLEKATK